MHVCGHSRVCSLNEFYERPRKPINFLLTCDIVRQATHGMLGTSPEARYKNGDYFNESCLKKRLSKPLVGLFWTPPIFMT